MTDFDAVVVGAGAAGLHCAGIAGQRGLRVLLIDHAERVAEKIRISGGGRCNFTNRDVGPSNFVSANPDFCRSALARYTPADFIALVDAHRIAWHEKHRGQLFCDESSRSIVDLLLAECARGRVERWQPCEVLGVDDADAGFRLRTSRGEVVGRQLVVATGGLSIPQIGASDWGYRIARRFGHRIVETRPALVPLTLSDTGGPALAGLAGVALPAAVEAEHAGRRQRFQEDLLFTHRGLSGPATLQISTYWQPGAAVWLDCTPDADLGAQLLAAKHGSRRHVGTVLSDHLPRRFADAWLAAAPALRDRPLADMPDRDLLAVATRLQRWELRPTGTEGYRKAEVTAGGVDTRELDSRSMASRRRPGLHFIGEVVDVTGWLGGYNFQWAWASAHACAGSLSATAAVASAGSEARVRIAAGKPRQL